MHGVGGDGGRLAVTGRLWRGGAVWTSAVGLRWSVVELQGRTHFRPRTYRKCHIVRAAKCRGSDFRCRDWRRSNFRLCCDCAACWRNFRSNRHWLQPPVDSRCYFAYRRRQYRRRRLHRQLQLRRLTLPNRRLKIETVRPFGGATIFLDGDSKLASVRVESSG